MSKELTYPGVLTKFLRRVSQSHKSLLSGVLNTHISVIYLPLFTDPIYTYYNTWKYLVKDLAVLFDVPEADPSVPTEAEYKRSLQFRLLTKLLQPLLHGPRSMLGSQWTTYAPALRHFIEEERIEVSPSALTQGVFSGLQEASNYLVFTVPAARKPVIARITAAPPVLSPDDRAYMENHMSRQRQLLLRAWETAFYRNLDFDGGATGVGYLHDGYLAINWNTFFAYTGETDISSTKMFTAADRPLYKGAPPLSSVVNLESTPRPSDYSDLPAQTGIVSHDDFETVLYGNDNAPSHMNISLFDPAYFVRRKVFSRERLERAVNRKCRIERSFTRATTKAASYHRDADTEESSPTASPSDRRSPTASKVNFAHFTIKPPSASPTTSPPPDASPPDPSLWENLPLEDDYAVIQREHGTYFAAPELFKTILNDKSNERAAWFAAMDRLSAVAQFSETGTFEDIVLKNNVNTALEDLKAERLELAKKYICDVVSLDALTKRQRTELLRLEKQQYLVGESSVPNTSQYKYHAKLLQLAANHYPIESIRHKYLIHHPYDGVVRIPFYTETALRVFQEVSKQPIPSFTGDIIGDNAPYIHAWATDALNYLRVNPVALTRTIRASKSNLTLQQSTPYISPRRLLWRPEDDVALLTHYVKYAGHKDKLHTFHIIKALFTNSPNMHNVERAALPNRARVLTNILKKVLTSKQLSSHAPGCFVLKDPTTENKYHEAIRLVLLIGAYKYLKKQDIDDLSESPILRAAWKLHEEQLTNIELPLTYGREDLPYFNDILIRAL